MDDNVYFPELNLMGRYTENRGGSFSQILLENGELTAGDVALTRMVTLGPKCLEQVGIVGQPTAQMTHGTFRIVVRKIMERELTAGQRHL